MLLPLGDTCCLFCGHRHVSGHLGDVSDRHSGSPASSVKWMRMKAGHLVVHLRSRRQSVALHDIAERRSQTSYPRSAQRLRNPVIASIKVLLGYANNELLDLARPWASTGLRAINLQAASLRYRAGMVIRRPRDSCDLDKALRPRQR